MYGPMIIATTDLGDVHSSDAYCGSQQPEMGLRPLHPGSTAFRYGPKHIEVLLGYADLRVMILLEGIRHPGTVGPDRQAL